MSDKEKVVEYELQIEDMLRALRDRLGEFEGGKKLNEFDQGRQTAYMEMMDIIKTRHSMILEVIDA